MRTSASDQISRDLASLASSIGSRDTGNARHAAVELLQRSIGNRATSRLLRRSEPSPPLARRADLRPGDLSHDVGVLQQKLNSAGARPRLAVDAEFGSKTAGAVVKFKRAHDLPGTVVADQPTWTALDVVAPDGHVDDGERLVPTGERADASEHASDGLHPELTLGSVGVAVVELHEKLNAVTQAGLPTRSAGTAPSDVEFDADTKRAVQEFQPTASLPPTGVADDPTWAALDRVAPGASMGGRDYGAHHRSMGESFDRIHHVQYAWAIEPSLADALRLRVIVGYQFITPEPSARAHIPTVLSGITETWNKFAALESAPASGRAPRKVDIEMDPREDPSATKRVTLHNGRGITNVEEFFIGNGTDVKIIAAHEFGHHIGVADEHQLSGGDYARQTGREEEIGDIHGAAPPHQVARELYTAIHHWDPNRRGTEAVAVVEGYGLEPGAFAQQVANRYQKIAGTGIGQDAQLIPVLPDEGNMFKRRRVTYPFTYTSDNLMGGMDALTHTPDRILEVEPRHVAHLADIVSAGLSSTFEAVVR